MEPFSESEKVHVTQEPQRTQILVMAQAQTLALDANHVIEVCGDDVAYYATLANTRDATQQKIKLP